MSTYDDNESPGHRAMGAIEDLADVRASDCLLALVGDSYSCGKHAEIGMALALDKPVVLLTSAVGCGTA